ncbi:hypothetical protein NLM33_18245 [Bradyrhizobium sp. CCGUVB1N3]|uniref:hypothetical protein n=1 Tax=Bradyrhizobium sp. CCGUVB1N3 TaxID=2949629 RepID=UPI0020B264FF|nr:hypothetical protein [Bradyrhizobium sp. CCGUVB1N3]MCP3472259.1 hypothetical protein [Bradyrhizobium sp. CCGUVB1N3]
MATFSQLSGTQQQGELIVSVGAVGNSDWRTSLMLESEVNGRFRAEAKEALKPRKQIK